MPQAHSSKKTRSRFLVVRWLLGMMVEGSRNDGKVGFDCREFEICIPEWEIKNRRLSKF